MAALEKNMLGVVVPSPWESAFFGRKIGTLQFSHSPSWLPHQHYDLIQAKIACQAKTQISLLQQQGFELVTGEVDFCFTLSTLPLPAHPFCYASTQDIPALHKLFESAFPHSRFRPPYFSLAEQQHFYRHWISQAVQGTFDDICLLEKVDDVICGAISVRLHAKTARIGLLAVSPNFQRCGVATRLLQAAKQWAKQQKADSLWVATQPENHAAIACYQTLGASQQACYHWFYKRNI